MSAPRLAPAFIPRAVDLIAEHPELADLAAAGPVCDKAARWSA